MTGWRPWLAVVVAFFCIPLFFGLGRRDLRGDEAAHSFMVERMLEIGDWLAPKNSPSENPNDIFLEKPPLKFWLVAAPIKLGLLPNDEFGMRFWDAVFAGLAIGYVFLIGVRLAGPVCGAVAALILFVHRPLLFEHGVRGNNMEAALLLCYCGGVYHFMKAMASDRATSTRRHAIAVALYFSLGFMTKDVAALFLPIAIAASVVLFPQWRARAVREQRVWMLAAAVAFLVIAPWFLYAQIRFGGEVWRTMFGTHVYTRLTSYLDPNHLHPWSFYFTSMYLGFTTSNVWWLVVAGLIVLLVQTVRRRWPDGGLVLLWLALPIAIISAGTSKLYHYAFPFLPPAALGGGYLIGLISLVAPAPLDRLLAAVHARLSHSLPWLQRFCARPAVRAILAALAVAAAVVAVVSIFYGPVRLTLSGRDVFKSSGVLRPVVLLLVAGVLAGYGRRTGAVALALVLAGLLPIDVYRDVFAELWIRDHPMRDARDCVLQVQARPENVSAGPRGLWVDGVDRSFGHEHYYYFRKVQPWQMPPKPDPEKIVEYLTTAGEQRPMLVSDSLYRLTMNGSAGQPGRDLHSPPLVELGDVVLLLPGPYAVCSSEAAYGSIR